MDPLDVLIEERARFTLDKVLETLEEDGAALPARVVYLVPGESVVWDNDCCQGQLTARVSAMAAHRSTATRTTTLTPCSIDYWTVTLEVVLLRCAATINNAGQAPSADALTVDGRRGLGDMYSILRTITRLPFADDVTSWLPQGPQGGCFGNAWTFTFKVDATPCDEYEIEGAA